MLEEQKDQRQFLKNKIKQLQQEIVQRTRNFMQSSRLRPRQTGSLTQNNLRMQQKYTQTDCVQNQSKNRSENESNSMNGNDQTKLNQWYKAFENDWERQVKNNMSLLKDQIKNKQKSQNFMQIANGKQTTLQNIIINRKNQTLSLINSSIQFNRLVKCWKNEKFIQYFNQFKQKSINSDIQLLKLFHKMKQKSTVSHKQDQKQKMSEKIDLVQKIKSLQNRCQFITKILNQSQEANYQLRLQIQQKQIKYRQQTEIIEKYSNQIQNYQNKCQQMKIKIEQMQIVKKEYLRAYTKVKEQKQQMQLKYIDLQEELQKLRTTLKDQQFQSKPETVQSNFTLVQEDEETRLKTIIEHSEDQIIQQAIRQTSTTNSLQAIRQIIQHGLMETNRSTSQKWIKSALIKLQQYQNQRQQQEQKRIQSQTNLQISVQQRYRTLFNNITRTNLRQKNIMQQNFNKAINKIINNLQKSKIENHSEQITKDFGRKSTPKLIRLQSQSYSQRSQSIYQSIQEQQVQQNSLRAPQIQDLVNKLNQSQKRYTQLKKKHDILILQKQQQPPKIIIAKNGRINQNFHQFMAKLVKNQQKISKKVYHHKFTQQFFDKISHKVFQTLCHFPIGNHRQVFFVPNNQQQLEDAIEVIYNFSLQFDHQQEARLRQFKNQAQSLTKVLQQIAVKKEVPPQMVVQSIKNNLKQQNSFAGTYVKSMIKKLSEQNQIKKKKSGQSSFKQIKQHYQQL